MTIDTWTFLVITLAAPFDGYVSTLPYPNYQACEEAMLVVPDSMGLAVEMVQCMGSSTPSHYIRPKRRPANLMEKYNG